MTRPLGRVSIPYSGGSRGFPFDPVQDSALAGRGRQLLYKNDVPSRSSSVSPSFPESPVLFLFIASNYRFRYKKTLVSCADMSTSTGFPSTTVPTVDQMVSEIMALRSRQEDLER